MKHEPSTTPALRDLRADAGFTQSALAKALRTSQAHLSEIENGIRGLSPAMALRIADVLNGRSSALGRRVTVAEVRRALRAPIPRRCPGEVAHV